LRFGVARRLGLDPASLLADDEPRFVWREEARFKHLAAENDTEQAGIASFGRAVAAALSAVAPIAELSLQSGTAEEIRARLLASGRNYVALDNLVALSWSAGIPVVNLRVFPWPQKRMAAMTTRVGDRACILLAKDANYPPWIAFYLAHELAHVALDHVGADQALVDLDADSRLADENDDEERAADAWALELLTGHASPNVVSADGNASARELARVAQNSAASLGIEPGTLALCFGYSTGQWAIANASLQRIYPSPAPVWRAINAVASRQLALDELPLDALDFLWDVLELEGVQ
jgi:hypothetical protein